MFLSLRHIGGASKWNNVTLETRFLFSHVIFFGRSLELAGDRQNAALREIEHAPSPPYTLLYALMRSCLHCRKKISEIFAGYEDSEDQRPGTAFEEDLGWMVWLTWSIWDGDKVIQTDALEILSQLLDSAAVDTMYKC